MAGRDVRTGRCDRGVTHSEERGDAENATRGSRRAEYRHRAASHAGPDRGADVLYEGVAVFQIGAGDAVLVACGPAHTSEVCQTLLGALARHSVSCWRCVRCCGVPRLAASWQEWWHLACLRGG